MSQIKGANAIMDGIEDLFVDSILSDMPIVEPLQMIPAKLKNTKWIRQNADYWEWQGLLQIEDKAKRLLKWADLAAGNIDVDDYFGSMDDEYSEIEDLITDPDNPLPDAMKLQFFPLIPTYYETLANEYMARGTSKVDYRAVDHITVNEILDKKQKEVESILMEYGQQRVMQLLMEDGYQMNDPKVQEQLQPEAILQKLPELQQAYNKGNIKTTFEIWATKMHNVDVNRFKMNELEYESFRSYLKSNQVFWYMDMRKSDYRVRLLNEALTFSITSPGNPWASEGSAGGFFDLLTVAQAINEDGEFFDESEMRSLESLLPKSVDGNYRAADIGSVSGTWDPHKSYEDNRKMGVDMRQLMSTLQLNSTAYDAVDYILGKSENGMLLHNTGYIRRSTIFWKTQRKIGFVYEIDENGESTSYNVDENWTQQVTPVYNTKFRDLRSSETLIFGQHVEWTWINETWGCKKYSGSHPTFTSINDDGDECAIYIGVGRKKPGPLLFQMKGVDNIWDSRLPIEGRDFAEKNTKSNSLVGLLTPPQIIFNIANNQLTEIMADNPGKVVAFDQNALPKHSFDGSWGRHNYAKARGVMNEYSFLLMDNSVGNTETPMQQNHVQVLDLSQSEKIMSNLSISRYAKELANDLLGFSPQRAVQQNGVTSSNNITATEATQLQTASYTRTETYFINHSDILMPRIHEMRTNVSQYYYANKPSFILNMMVSVDERAMFKILGTDLMARQLQIFVDNSTQRKQMLNNILDWVMRNNTNGGTILDAPELMQIDSIANLNLALKRIDDRQQQRAQEAHQRDLEKIEADAKVKERLKDKEFNQEAIQNMLDRQVKLLSEQIRSSGYAAMQDMNQNNQSDQVDLLNSIKEDKRYQETMGLDREKLNAERENNKAKADIENRKIDDSIAKSNNDVVISKTNRNRYDKE